MANVYDAVNRQRFLSHRIYCDPLSADIIGELVGYCDTLQQEVSRLRAERLLIDAALISERELHTRWRDRAESAESSLLAVREALEKMVEFGERQGWKHVYIDASKAALSTTSAQAEGIKARWQAEDKIENP